MFVIFVRLKDRFEFRQSIVLALADMAMTPKLVIAMTIASATD